MVNTQKTAGKTAQKRAALQKEFLNWLEYQTSEDTVNIFYNLHVLNEFMLELRLIYDIKMYNWAKNWGNGAYMGAKYNG